MTGDDGAEDLFEDGDSFDDPLWQDAAWVAYEIAAGFRGGRSRLDWLFAGVVGVGPAARRDRQAARPSAVGVPKMCPNSSPNRKLVQ